MKKSTKVKVYNLDESKSSNKPVKSLAEVLKEAISFPNIVPDLSPIEPPKLPEFDTEELDWIGEQNEKRAYLTELQTRALEKQLAITKGSQVPKYDIVTGIIFFMDKEIKIPLNTNIEMVCRVVLKNIATMRRKWSWDEIVEENREDLDLFTSRRIYTAVIAVNEKVAQETSVKDFLLARPITTVRLNPNFVPK